MALNTSPHHPRLRADPPPVKLEGGWPGRGMVGGSGGRLGEGQAVGRRPGEWGREGGWAGAKGLWLWVGVAGGASVPQAMGVAGRAVGRVRRRGAGEPRGLRSPRRGTGMDVGA